MQHPMATCRHVRHLKETPPHASGNGEAKPPTTNGNGEAEPPAANGNGEAEPPAANGNGEAEACEPRPAGEAVVTHALGDWGFTLSGRDAPLKGTAGRFSARPFPAVKHPARGSRSSPNRYRREAAMTGTGSVLPAQPPTQGDHPTAR
jgi:hypothetical protein